MRDDMPIANSPFPARKPRKHEPHKHDALCVTLSTLTFCWCKCAQCWDPLRCRCVCSQCHCQRQRAAS